MVSTHVIPAIPTLEDDRIDRYDQQLQKHNASTELSEEDSDINRIKIDLSRKRYIHSAVYDSIISLGDYYRAVISKYQDVLKNVKVLVEQENSQDSRNSWALLGNGLVDMHVWTYQCSDNEETFIERLQYIALHRQEQLRKHLSHLEQGLDMIENLMNRSIENSLPFNATQHEFQNHCATVLDTIEKLTATKPDLKLAMSAAARFVRASHQESSNTLPRIPIVLCLDGGGIRSFSSLLILKALMDAISTFWDESNISDPKSELPPQKPCEVFDFMFGSSSGGLVAIMLGRLEMGLDEATERFLTYTTEVFSESRGHQAVSRILSRPKYNGKKIVDATRRLVDKYDPTLYQNKWRRNKFVAPELKCKTGVISLSRNSTGPQPFMFRSYQIPTETKKGVELTLDHTEPYSAEIWEVARATSAAPLLFAPQTIDGIKYYGGGLGVNNPTLEAIRELEALGADLKSICIVSIGSGSSRIQPRKHRSPLSRYLDAVDFLRTSATEVEMTSHQVSAIARMIDGCDYFRFSALYDRKIALDELHSTEYIASVVYEHIRSPDTQAALKECASVIVSKVKGKD